MERYGESGLHGAEAKAHWRKLRTDDIKKVCYELRVSYNLLTEYQYRVAGIIDIYPTNGAWHNIKTGQRGNYHTIASLRRTVKIALQQNA